MPPSRNRFSDDKFFKALEEGKTVTRAAGIAGYSVKMVYHQRKMDKDFAESWDLAKEIAIQRLEEEADRRAMDGTTKPIFFQGQEVGEIREFSDQLLMFRLKALRPEIYKDRPHERPVVPQDSPQSSLKLEDLDDNDRQKIREVLAGRIERSTKSSGGSGKN